MNTLELKSTIFQLVQKSNNENLLQSVLNFLKTDSADSETGKLYNSLTEEQKNELMLAFEESENEENLVDARKIFKRKK